MDVNREGIKDAIRVRKAFVSVHDRTELVRLAKFLEEKGIGLYATEGTASFLREASVSVMSAQELTGFAEILSGKVKSLSPRLHAAILFDRLNSDEKRQLENEKIPAIDMVIVNFYPFHKITSQSSLTQALPMIDIGGPAALRAAAKNFRWVVPVPEPASYDRLIEEMSRGEPSVGVELSLQLAARVYEITSSYDSMVSSYLLRVSRSGAEERSFFPENILLNYRKLQGLRYGENPHQAASFYVCPSEETDVSYLGRQLHGKQLSFNNLLDLDAAVSTCRQFEAPSCVIIKHRTPCGVSESDQALDAYRLARECDPLSAFGGVAVLNRTVTAAVASEMVGVFLELVAAPSFEPEALNALSRKKSLRLIELSEESLARGRTPRRLLRSGPGGLLLQQEDTHPESPREWKVVSHRTPTEEEQRGLFFLWRVVRHVVSNAVVIGKADRTLGIGAGQTSRVDAVQMALHKARRAGHNVRGAWLASDGFFPFRDSIDLAARAGISAIVEPGGSIRDEECIRAADEHGIALCFTGRRCFKH